MCVFVCDVDLHIELTYIYSNLTCRFSPEEPYMGPGVVMHPDSFVDFDTM